MLFAHVMPWFSRSEKELGWHWRMNRSSEEVLSSGQVASHYRPLIGPYDSSDESAVRLQVAWMKRAGFDGVLADWYGINDHFDYADIHSRTQKLFEECTRQGLKIGIVYEDQSIGNAIRQGKLPSDAKGAEAEKVGRWLVTHWLKRPNWFRFNGKPTILVFGPQAFAAHEWAQFRRATGDISLISLHERRAPANGVFDWPIPDRGIGFQEQFPSRVKESETHIAVAYPRFRDYYEEGGQKGYAEIADAEGETLRRTLDLARASGAQAIQVATWNDWQEGTQVEPSVELRFRDLITIQNFRRQIDPTFPYKAADLQHPLDEFLRTRKNGTG